MISSTWIVLNFLLTALPRVPKAWVAKRILPPFISIILRFSGSSLWALDSLNPTTPDTTIKLWLSKISEALTPVKPIEEATMMFLMPSCSAFFFASLRVRRCLSDLVDLAS